ncbi:MAG: alpha/beta fold hydrolase [Legionellaceae bacterium]|nr:alpha/beta fold hydrolase [Legionellaceae bacterium]
MTRQHSWVWAIVAFIILGPLLLYLLQRALIYAPSKITPSRQAFKAEDMQHIRLITQDSIPLNAWYKPSSAQQPTFIIFHGNAGHIGGRMSLARQLLAQGFGVLLLEYRGYGGNPGRPTEQGLYQDARAGMDFLKQQDIPTQQIVLYGESLGTGVATKMASEHPKSCALILQSPYTTLNALRKHHYAWLPIEPWDKFNSLERITSIRMPLLVLHGTEDKVVPYEEGEVLFSAANMPKQWVALKGKGHSNLWTPQFVDIVTQFIHRHC